MSFPLIPITINDRSVSVRANATLLQACESVGVEVPRFCYHESLSVAGNCRRCLVEVKGSPKPVVSCARPVSKGRVLYTETPLVRKAREAVLEFLLLNHPLDCPICDQGGECDLQEEALTYGSDRGRTTERKRSVEDKECGPVVKSIRTRCIHCTRCIRFSTEIAGRERFGAFGRGEDTEIGSYLSSRLRTELAGNLVDLCPVGALTSKPYAYRARPWELRRLDSFDPFDAIGAEVSLHVRGATASSTTSLLGRSGSPIPTSPIAYASSAVSASAASATPVISASPSLLRGRTEGEQILRVLPRVPALSGENWISDRSRYGIEGRSLGRLLRPHRRSTQSRPAPTRWLDVLRDLAPRLLGRGRATAQPLTPALPPQAPASGFSCSTPLAASSSAAGEAPRRILLGPQLSLERLHSTVAFASSRGRPRPQITNGRSAQLATLDVDHPSLLGLNRSLSSFSSLTAPLLSIGGDIRHEASLLATLLRRNQSRLATLYATLAPFAAQRLRARHSGASLRSLQALLENRHPLAVSLLANVVGGQSGVSSVLLSAEATRSAIGPSLIALSLSLGRYLCSASSRFSGFGVVQASTGRLSSAVLGISSSRALLRSTSGRPFISQGRPAPTYLAQLALPLLVTIHHQGFTTPRRRRAAPFRSAPARTTLLHLSTHPREGTPEGVAEAYSLPVRSFYEESSHRIVLDGSSGGRLRFQPAAVASPSESRPLSVLWTALSRRHGAESWSRWTGALAAKDLILPRGALLERTLGVFPVSPFGIEAVEAPVLANAALLHPTGVNFFQADPLSAHSPTRGACALFLGSETSSSFSRER